MNPKIPSFLNAMMTKVRELTSPPFLYATVVKVYPWKNNLGGLEADQVIKNLETLPESRELRAFRETFPSISRLGSLQPAKTGSSKTDPKKDQPEEAAMIAVNGKIVEVIVPKDKKVKPGDTVKVYPPTFQIVDVVELQFGGEITIVRKVLNDDLVEVGGDAPRIVFSGQFGKNLQSGDRVTLDSTMNVITMNLGKEDDRFNFESDTKVSWEDIGGLAEAKKKMIEVIEMPHRFPNLYRSYKKKPAKGVLLFGPPGCGKTRLVKAVVTSIKNTHGGKGAKTAFIYVKGAEILERFVGVAEQTVRGLFQLAKKHKETHGYPAVIMIDEAEAILQRRGSGVSSDVEKTIVPAFLNEMDGLDDSGAIVILATNRPDILDPAITRDGRIDKKILVGRPDKEAALAIFQIHLRGVPVAKGLNSEGLARLATDELFSENRVIYEITLTGGETKKFTLANLASGALIAGIVDEATTLAIDRDKEKGDGNASGLSKDDILKALEVKFRENFNLNHTDDLKEFAADFSDKVRAVRKLTLSN